MTYSEEQEHIFEYAANGVKNMIVQAVAGAGKTTTLVRCATLIDPSKKILLLAHNKSTRDTLKERVVDRKNIRVFTLHGLAYRMFTEHFETEPDIDDDKYRKHVNHHLSDYVDEDFASLKPSVKMAYKRNIFDLLNKARHNLKQSAREIKRMAVSKYDMTLVSNECEAVQAILKWGREHLDTVDFQDLLWLPNELGYFTKRYLSDVIMLDEAQDASVAQQNVISRCMKRNTRLFAFGDRDQTINSWCGSDTEAFEHLKDTDLFRRGADEFPLTTNYRCGRKIIEFAKRFTSNDIKAHDNASEGSVNFNVKVSEVVPGDMVLCRNIAPLMEFYRRKVSDGVEVYFRGEELGRNLIEAVDCSKGDSMVDIIWSLKSRLVSTWAIVTKGSDTSDRETATDPLVVSLYDVIRTLESLPPWIQTRDDLYVFTNDIFSDEGKSGIQLSTIHRAKGLESDRVFVICPSLIPSKLAKMDWEIEEEKHLAYVMATRPKNSLNFVSESDIAPSSAYSNANAFYQEVCDIRREVNDKLAATGTIF